ncbi:MAG: tetratricopeptide repeat protein [Cyanosarcina radialis HA8281-LM2]|jgi:tetratricopeptide (TPR) repeat protein/tRNA A-37 threonylcarbamoyl transferase component Bud32|nr:tetratricopeptide repeat protein [Cyanosarcina radialis HA8281-LM2]
MVGRILDGRYRVVQPLGQGGFAKTYIAQDLRVMNRQVVVKQLKPSTNNPDVLREAQMLFMQEAEVLAKLGREHPQIPDLLAYFEENQEFYLVQEFVEGTTFSEQISAGNQMTEARVLEMITEVLLILKFVHQNNVIHRDIKPSNLMRRDRDGKMILIDFGAVKQVQALALNTGGQTTFTRVIGSPGYMAREQLAGIPRFSSDIYALGMTAIQALTGVYPDHLPIDNQSGEIDWQRRAQVSKKLADIIDKMVRSHFLDRYQTVDEVLKDIEKLLQPEPKPWWQQGLSFVKQRYLVAIPVVLAVFGLGILAPMFFSSPTKNPVGVLPSDSASELQKKGDRLIELKRYDEALTEFQKALEIDIKSLPAWNGKGKALYNLSRYQDSIEAFDKAMAIDPRSFDAWYGKGLAWYQLGATRSSSNNDSEANLEANKAFEKAVEIQPQSAEALTYYASTLILLGRYDRAVAISERALKINPNVPESWFYQGRALVELQRYPDAITAFDRAIAINSNLAEAWAGKGLALNGLKQYRAALRSFDRALEIRSGLLEALLGKGKALQQLSRDREALAAFMDATNAFPDNAESWNLKGEVLFKLQRYEEAQESFNEALRIEPDFLKAKQNLDLVQQKLNSTQ